MGCLTGKSQSNYCGSRGYLACQAAPRSAFMEIVMKRCSKCKTFKQLGEFHKNRANNDGYQTHCIACRRIDKPCDRGRASSKACQKKYRSSPKGIARARRGSRAQRLKDPEKTKARKAVSNAIQNGKLPRPDSQLCSCKKPAQQYHHYLGYAKENWLDVVPKCTDCHTTLHRTAKEAC